MVTVDCVGFHTKIAERESNGGKGVDSRGLLFDFEVKVSREDSSESFSSRLERSYASLVVFDKSLKKIFPNSRKALPQLPLVDVSTTTPGASSSSSSSSGGSPSSTALGRTLSTSSVSSVGSGFGRVADVEALNSRCGALTEYFCGLLKVPEIVTSDLLRCFLDEESNDGKKFDLLNLQNEAFSSVDLLLSVKSFAKKTVLKCHTVTLKAEPDQCVCWVFYTKKHDIGFSVDLNGKEGVKYERVNSHEKTVKGMFQVPPGAGAKNEVKVYFDNSYSKLRAKDLRYVCGIFSQEEWNTALEAASEKNEAKKQYALRRLLLEDSLRDRAKSITGQVHANLGGTSGHSLAALLSTAKEKDELQRILDEKLSLMQAYEDTLLVLQNEKQTAAAALQELENTRAAKDVLEDELLAANADIELFKERAQTAQQNLQANQESLMEALGHSKSSEEVELMLTRALETRTEELNEAKGDLEESRLAYSMLEKKLAQAVSERKQLKQYGKTAKGELERLEGEKRALEVDMEAAANHLSDVTDKLAEAHEEILRLQSLYSSSQESLEALRRAEEKRIAAPMMVAGTVGSPSQHRGSALGGGVDVNVDVDRSHDDEEHARRLSTLSMDDGWQQMGGDGDDDGETRDSFADMPSVGESGLNKSGVKGEGLDSSNADRNGEQEHLKDGKWVYVPPPKITTASGFFGF